MYDRIRQEIMDRARRRAALLVAVSVGHLSQYGTRFAGEMLDRVQGDAAQALLAIAAGERA